MEGTSERVQGLVRPGRGDETPAFVRAASRRQRSRPSYSFTSPRCINRFHQSFYDRSLDRISRSTLVFTLQRAARFSASADQASSQPPRFLLLHPLTREILVRRRNRYADGLQFPNDFLATGSMKYLCTRFEKYFVMGLLMGTYGGGFVEVFSREIDVTVAGCRNEGLFAFSASIPINQDFGSLIFCVLSCICDFFFLFSFFLRLQISST